MCIRDRKIFIDYLNNIHSTIKFTSSHSSTNIPFLDVNVSLTNDGNISIDLFTKPTDKHQHLLYSSCHPLHTKKDSLALRLRRICSTDATFHTRTAQLATCLLKRGYNRNFVNKQIRRAADIPRQLTLQAKDINKLLIHHSLTSLTSSKNISICCSPLIAAKASSSIRLL